jgi:MFS family permease
MVGERRYLINDRYDFFLLVLDMKKRCFLTTIYAIAFMGLGVLDVIGTTLPALADLFGESSSPGLSFALLSRGVGWFVGTMGIGPILDRYPEQAHRVWVLGTLIFGGSTILIPYSGSTLGFSAVLFVFAASSGAILLMGNLLVLRVWDGTFYTASGINMIHLGNSIGSAVMPLIVVSIGLEESKMYSAYQTLGLIVLSTGLLPGFFTAPEKIKPTDFIVTPRSIVRVKFWSIIVLFFFYFSFQGALTDAGDWITTYIVDRSQGTENDGAFATSAFWASVLVARMLYIPLAMYFNYDILIGFAFILCFTGSIISVTLGIEEYYFTVLSYVCLGLGLAPMFPAGLLLARSRMELTGKWVSVIVSGGVVGSVLLPTITGLLLSKSLQYLPWTEFICVMVMLIMYVIVYLLPKVRNVDQSKFYMGRSVYNFQSTIPTFHECDDYEGILADAPSVKYVQKEETIGV